MYINCEKAFVKNFATLHLTLATIGEPYHSTTSSISLS